MAEIIFWSVPTPAAETVYPSWYSFLELVACLDLSGFNFKLNPRSRPNTSRSNSFISSNVSALIKMSSRKIIIPAWFMSPKHFCINLENVVSELLNPKDKRSNSYKFPNARDGIYVSVLRIQCYLKYSLAPCSNCWKISLSWVPEWIPQFLP